MLFATPLRYSHYERESPRQGLYFMATKGHSIWGYNGPRSPRKSKHLRSAHTHPQVIDTELAKELKAGHILGPFTKIPLPNLRCSGLGVVPKKNGKWRMIMPKQATALIIMLVRMTFHCSIPKKMMPYKCC